MSTSPGPLVQLERDFARATVVELLEWLIIGILVILVPLFAVAFRVNEPLPPWLPAGFVSLVLACALAPAVLVQLRGRRARRLIGALGTRVRECGLMGNALVAVLDDNIVVSVEGSVLLPAAGPWVSFERIYDSDRTTHAITLASYRHARRRFRGLGAIQVPKDLTDAHPVMRGLAGLFGGAGPAGPIVSFRLREIGSKEVSEGFLREAEVDFMVPEWDREGSTFADRLARVGELLDQAMATAWDGPIALGRGTLSARGRA